MAKLTALFNGKDNISNKLKGIGQQGTNMGSKLKKAGKIGAGSLIAIGSAAAAVSIKGVKEFAKFEKGMNEVFTLLPGISQDNMGKMSEDVKKFSKEFGVLPEKVVPSLYQAISAGVPKDNVFDFMEGAFKAAVAGVTDMTVAVDGLSTVVNAYGAETINANQASDYMFTAVRLGKTTFDQLSASMSTIIPVAASLNVGMDQVSAALSTMTSQGTDTQTAAVAIRQALVELGDSGTVVSKAFSKATGKSFKDFIKGGGNIGKAMAILDKHAAKSGLAVNELFSNVRSGQAALQLTGNGAKKFVTDLEAMAASAGATDAAFEIMDRGLSRTWDRIAAYTKVQLINVGDKLAPYLQKGFDTIVNAWPRIKSIIGKVKAQFSILASFTKYRLSGEMANAFTWLTEIIMPKLTQWFDDNWPKITKAWNNLQLVVVGAIKFLWPIVREFITWFGETFGETFSDLLDIFNGITDFLIGVFTGDWEKIWGGLQLTVEGFGKLVEDVLVAPFDLLFSLIEGIAAGLEKISWSDWFTGLGDENRVNTEFGPGGEGRVSYDRGRKGKQYASGIGYHPGGNAWIGEAGKPELVTTPKYGSLPTGSKVTGGNDTAKILELAKRNASGGGIINETSIAISITPSSVSAEGEGIFMEKLSRHKEEIKHFFASIIEEELDNGGDMAIEF